MATYPAPPRPTLADLDPESATTDALIAPAPERMLANLPAVLRALCDHLPSGEATALDAAYRLASIVDVVEGAINPPGSPSTRH